MLNNGFSECLNFFLRSNPGQRPRGRNLHCQSELLFPGLVCTNYSALKEAEVAMLVGYRELLFFRVLREEAGGDERASEGSQPEGRGICAFLGDECQSVSVVATASTVSSVDILEYLCRFISHYCHSKVRANVRRMHSLPSFDACGYQLNQLYLTPPMLYLTPLMLDLLSSQSCSATSHGIHSPNRLEGERRHRIQCNFWHNQGVVAQTATVRAPSIGH
ncbi:hypothetical protein L218DRAFT_445291 [Marasmius fiardii PR-910]|nr:hypothetical protein L218DRAFT_445291 [Marasmius fiardii PR-910]